MCIERSIDKATAELMSASNADEMDGASGYYPEKQTKPLSGVWQTPETAKKSDGKIPIATRTTSDFRKNAMALWHFLAVRCSSILYRKSKVSKCQSATKKYTLSIRSYLRWFWEWFRFNSGTDQLCELSISWSQISLILVWGGI